MAKVPDSQTQTNNRTPDPVLSLLGRKDSWTFSNTTALQMLGQIGVCRPGEPSTPLPLPPPAQSPTLTGDIKAGVRGLLVKAGLMEELPKVKYAPVLQAAPPPTLWGEIKSAGYESRTPIQFVEKATGRAWDHGVRSIRGLLHPAADISLRDTFSQAASALADVNPFHWKMDGNNAKLTFGWDLGKSGDQRAGPRAEVATERAIDRNRRPLEHGDYDIRMAVGWKPEGPVKYNGKMVTLDKPIDNMLAIFVRDAKGNIEILDPTTKVQSLTELRRLPAAMFQMPWNSEDPIDSRWRESGGRYVAMQLLPLLASGGTAGLAKAGAIAPKVPQIAKAAEAIEKVSTVVKSSTLYRSTVVPWAGATGIAGINQMGDMLSQNFYFTPEAIRKISDSIANAITNPRGVTAEGTLKNLNEALDGHSYKDGSNSQQIYVPSLRTGQEPWTRLQQSLLGIVEAHKKSNNPWQDWSRTKMGVDVPELRAELSANPKIQYAFYTSVEKAINGKALTDQDIFVMRVGFNLGDVGGKHLPPAGAAGLKFTEAERKETIKAVTDQLNGRLAYKALDAEHDDAAIKKQGQAFIKKHGIDLETVDPGNPQFTPAQLKSFVSGEITSNGNILQAQRQAEIERAQALAMSMSMYR